MPAALLKHERFAEVLLRLEAAPPCSDFRTARALIDATLNAVEDELSGVSFQAENWYFDGRMYPVQDDNVRVVPGYPEVWRLTSAGHDTYVGSKGSYDIREKDERGTGRGFGKIVISKAGSDHKGVWHD